MDARSPRGALLGASALVLGLLPTLMGAGHRTRNFHVEAPTPEAARAVGEHAEKFRASIARAWLGRELPDWTEPCPIRVRITGGEAGGVTNFDFLPRGGVRSQSIEVEGRLDRVLASALPHEVTHTIFAAYFGGPMPRWADEGASVLSEDKPALDLHEQIVASLLDRRGQFAFTSLFSMKEYPSDLMGFYGQGYSVSRFLVSVGGRPRFLRFVKEGMDAGWDDAARKHYSLASCRELERGWHSWLAVNTRRAGSGAIASNVPAPVVIRAQDASLPALRR